MKKLIPYILSYVLVTAGIVTFAHFSRLHPLLPNSVTVQTTLSHAELATKLQQVGLPEASVQTFHVKPAPLFSVVYLYVLYAVIFGTFMGLAHLFQRVIRADVPRHDHAASYEGSSVNH